MNNLESCLDKAWEDTKKLFCYPPLRKPVLSNTLDTAAIDMLNNKIWINEKFVEFVHNVSILNKNPVDYTTILKGILQHEVNHYILCPSDVSNMIILQNEVKKVTKEYYQVVANYFFDFVINLDIIKRKKRTELLCVYKNLLMNNPLDLLNVAFLQKKTKENLNVKITDELLLNKLESLCKIDYLNKRKWRKSSRRFAEIIKDLLTEENINDLNPLDVWDFKNYDDGEIEKGIIDASKELDILEFKEIFDTEKIYLPYSPIAYFYEQQSKKFLIKAKGKQSGAEFQNGEHKKYEISDSYSSVDVFNSYGKFMPGFSQSWKNNNTSENNNPILIPDLIIAIDSSMSMPDPSLVTSSAVIGAFCAARYYLERNSLVATYNFSNNIYITDFSNDKNLIYSNLCLYQKSGTFFGLDSMKKLVDSARNKTDIMLISDMEIFNLGQTIEYLKNLRKTNRIGLFMFGDAVNNEDYAMEISKIFSKTPEINIYYVKDIKEIPKIVIGECYKNYSKTSNYSKLINYSKSLRNISGDKNG